ncbi:MAG: hypothetical protein ABH891_04630 [Candidatus Omnitrophota bacterium]
MNPLWLAGIAVLVLNLPFGFWRVHVRKFSPSWFLAVHLPVPFVIAIRFLMRLGFHPVTYPVLVGAFFTGQFLGGKIAKSK